MVEMQTIPLLGMIISCLVANFVFVQIKNPVIWIGAFIPYVMWILFLLKLAS